MFCITKFVVQLAIDFDCKEIWVHFLQFHILPCCITKFVVQLVIDFDCKEIWVHFLQFHILPCSYNSPFTFNKAMNLCKKRKKEVVVLFTIDYDQTLWFIWIYDFFLFFIFNFIVSYQVSKIHLLCAVYKCWGWMESTKVHIYSSQKT